MDTIGALSAATLGYITNDIKGAKLAYNSYRNFRKQMAPVTRGRKSDRSDTPPYTPNKKRKVTSAASYRSRSATRSVSRPRKSTVQFQGTNIQTAGRRRGKATVSKKGVKRRVKVSGKFKRKVIQALSANAATGRLTETSYVLSKPADNAQTVLDLGHSVDNKISMFSPAYVQYVASVLYNNATTTQTPLSSTANFFSNRTFKCMVKNQRVTYNFKNNTARTMFLKLYLCSPKSKQSGNGYAASEYWTNSMFSDAQGFIGTTQGNKVNISNSTINTLWTTPRTSSKWNNMYQTEVTTVTLEAGKIYTYTVDGPNDKMYDLTKYWTDGVQFDNIQKMVKQLICVWHLDVVNTTGATVGRFTDILPGDTHGLLIEQILHTSIEVPEQAGFAIGAALPAINTMQPINQKKDAYAFISYVVPQSGPVAMVDDENPVVDINQ